MTRCEPSEDFDATFFPPPLNQKRWRVTPFPAVQIKKELAEKAKTKQNDDEHEDQSNPAALEASVLK